MDVGPSLPLASSSSSSRSRRPRGAGASASSLRTRRIADRSVVIALLRLVLYVPVLSSVLWLRSSVRFLLLRACICHSISQFSYSVMGSVRARRAKGFRPFVPIYTKDPALAIPLSIPSYLPQPPRAPPPSFPIQVLPAAPL